MRDLRLLKLIYCFFLLVCPFLSYSQPANDHCSNAASINIASNGYGIGTFNSSTDNITSATVQSGETFAPAVQIAGQSDKSMWYKFTLPTTRSVKVILEQAGATITAGDVGFTVYRSSGCLPSNANISTKLTPIVLFGNTFHPCIDSGTYYVQVSAKAVASGLVYIVLETAFPGSDYDRPSQAFDFGTLSPGVRTKTYLVDCQSFDDGNETCTALGNSGQYVKSTWHVFRTPAYFDYIDLMVAMQSMASEKIGFRIYDGDVTASPYSSLPVVVSCDSLELSGSLYSRRNFKCNELQFNKTYSIQLFFKHTFFEKIKLSLAMGGTNPTQAPVPVTSGIPATNMLGVLPSTAAWSAVTATDFFGCNSRHTVTACGTAINSAGVFWPTNNATYNMSSFFSFTIATTSIIDVTAFVPGCFNPLLMRLYNQGTTNNCSSLSTSNIINQFLSNSGSIYCLPPGDYTLQVMGRDEPTSFNSWDFQTFSDGDSIPPMCLQTDLGNQFDLTVNVQKVTGISKYSLSSTGAFDTINATNGVIQPLVKNVLYISNLDTFQCANTVRPWDTTCAPANNKAIYRQMMIADSGVLSIFSPNGVWNKLYSGNASALASAQGVFSYPGKIQNLPPYTSCIQNTECDGVKVCVVPGTYTHVTFGSDGSITQPSQPRFRLNTVSSLYGDPASPENMGDIVSQIPATGGFVWSDMDYYSCKDNAIPINGLMPCSAGGTAPATKAIYRQFYISTASEVSISGFHLSTVPGCGGFVSSGSLSLFKGKISDGLSTLTPMPDSWVCFQEYTVPDCELLQPGWYTVVSYGSGPSYADPFQQTELNGYGSYVAKSSRIKISIAPQCAGPKYNRPHKAAIDTITNQPFLIEWGANGGHTAAYPKTDRTYQLYREYFNCTNDTPFINHPINACNASMTKVAYWVFKTTQESFVQIETKGYWGAVYAGDVRTDSMSFATATPIQPCLLSGGQIQLCKLQPGSYTLVLFASSMHNCKFIEPVIYIDQVGYSRFDHAAKAYDFGLVPPDSVWHKGKPGDVNPYDASRSPSNDFIYCTTGSQQNDPGETICNSEYNANIYIPGNNNPMFPGSITPINYWNMPRRNLWYTFVVDKGGHIKVRVNNKTIGKQFQYRFAVYKSNVDGSLAFSTVVANGLVDSTMGQGLSFVAHNFTGSSICYSAYSEISFYREPCSAVPERYYIMVENPNANPVDPHGMRPNSQVEVSILLDSVNAFMPSFDHYSTAGVIGTNLGAGSFSGPVDNFSCATTSITDPVNSPYPANASCGKKTLWYKFSTTVTGKVRYRIKINGGYQFGSNYDQVILLRQLVPGDSSVNGLVHMPYTAVININQGGGAWYQTCVTPGTYYLFLSGCNRTNEDVIPEIEFIEEAGDLCSTPVIATLSGPVTTTATVRVDCHTIGTDYGEFNQTLTCPGGATTSQYKTSWFQVNITGTDTLDVTSFLTENTNADATDIKYRIMEGDCSAMQEQSCVTDALTQNTYQCLRPGNYFVQVFVPQFKNGEPVTGEVTLHLAGATQVDTCAPVNNCLSTAVFIPVYDCNQGDTVRFTNLSTYGTDIQYLWDFGYNNQTSTQVSPAFVYPALTTDQVYTVKLKVTNTGCEQGAQNVDTASAQILVKARPKFSLGKDTVLCAYGSSLILNAATWPGTTYQWSNGMTTPSITLTPDSAIYNIWVAATYNGCTKRDTISVGINPINKTKQNKYLCGNDSVYLESVRGYGESYSWSGPLSYWTNANAGNIYVRNTGLYTNQIGWKGCLVTDTFNVYNTQEPFIKADTTICFPFQSFVLNATTPGGVSYTWQNGSINPALNVTAPGIYTVEIWNGSCLKKDSFRVLSTAAVVNNQTSVHICAGQTYTLPWGGVVATTGTYRDTIRYFANGCDSLITTVNLKVINTVTSTKTASICIGDQYTLPSGAVVSSAGYYIDTTRSQGGCDSLVTKLTLAVHPKPVLTLTKSNDVNCMLGTAELQAAGGYSYLWTPSSSLSNAMISNPVASPTATTTYIVQGTSREGCSARDSITVIVAADPMYSFELPDAFTPNNDGLNDCFGVKSWGAVTELKFSIYNRWGQLLFYTTDPTKCWDGTFKGAAQGPQVFVYTVNALTICGKINRKGTVMLIR